MIIKTTRDEDWRVSKDDYRDVHGRGFVEAVCAHGIGHHKGIHGCDGCCGSWPKDVSDKVTEDK